MAKPKKITRAPARSTKKAKAPAPKSRARAPKKPDQLSTEERQKLLKPGEGYEDLVERFVLAWTEHQSTVRVPELSPAKVRSMLGRAKKAWTREEALRAKQEAALRPVVDARMLAEDAVWRAVLDVNAVARGLGRRSTTVANAFAFLSEALSTGGGEPKE